MPRKLTRLDVREVSLVNRAANRRKFAIVKADETGGDEMPDPITQDEDFMAVLDEPIEGEDDLLRKVGLLKAEISDKARNAARGALRMLAAYKDEIPAGATKDLAALAGYGYPAPKGKKGVKPDEDEPDDAEEKRRRQQKADAPVEIPADLLPLIKADPELHTQVVALLKAAGDPVAQASLAIFKRQADRIQKAETRAENERRERLNDAALTKAATFAHVPASTEEIAAVLRHLEDSGVEIETVQKAEDGSERKVKQTLAASFERLLKSVEEVVKASELLRPRGSDQPMPGSALGKITQMAEALVQKGAGKLTQEQAWAQVVKANPGLYKEYRKEQAAATREVN